MTGTRPSLRWIVGFALLLALGERAQGAERIPLHTFVTTRYFHGIPFAEARAYGPSAIPELAAMLREESFIPYWENIVGTLGAIGDPDAIDVLTSFLSGLHGEVSVDAFRAALAVPPALGHISRADEKALGPLMRLAGRRPLEGSPALSFSYRRYQGDALEEVLGRVAIQGLGISGNARALSFLEERKKGARADWQDNFAEAIELNKRVRRLGVEEVFGHAN